MADVRSTSQGDLSREPAACGAFHMVKGFSFVQRVCQGDCRTPCVRCSLQWVWGSGSAPVTGFLVLLRQGARPVGEANWLKAGDGTEATVSTHPQSEVLCHSR